MSEALGVGADGWLDGVERLASPNCDRRPPGSAIDLILMHNISLPPGVFGAGHVQRLFTNTLPAGAHPFLDQLAHLRVSAHFLIERCGRLTQFVACVDRAWHAGESRLGARPDCNAFSIGIELEGTDFVPFTDAQYRTLERLTSALIAAYPIVAAHAHSEVAIGRKTDPGPFFDWQRVPALARLRRGRG
jgi:AmpD protein